MNKKVYRIAAMVTALLLFVAACTPAATSAPSGVTGTQAVPETGATLPVVATLGAAVECVGVDTQAMMTAGQTLYTENCASCHGEQGEGVGDFPPLAASQVATVADVQTLVQGYFSVEAHPKTLTPEDYSALFSFVRGSFGNTAPAVCPIDITIPVP